MAKDKKASKPQKATPTGVKAYLVAYNALSAVGWGYVLALIVLHLFNLDGQSRTLAADSLQAKLPELLRPMYAFARTSHSRAGAATTIVQSFALLEVVHAALGWVRSPVLTTAMQVASRIFLVWGILARFPSVHSNALFASMVFAWSLTEVIRYTFYALNLLGYNPRFLLWLRYTTFYILYPIGAGSEAFMMFATLPKTSPLDGAWALAEYGRSVLFLIWWPGLYVMYTYMISQRRKVFGPARKVKAT